MRLGDALMDAIGGEGVMPDTPAEAAGELVRWYGSQAAAARGLGIPRRTLRGWLAGKSPRGGWSWLLDVIREFDRRDRVSSEREEHIRGADSDIEISGTYQYNGGGSMRGAENRHVSIGGYLAPGTMSRVLDRYLGGADADALADAFAAGITDGGFYAETFDPNNGDGYWDVDWIEGLM